MKHFLYILMFVVIMLLAACKEDPADIIMDPTKPEEPKEPDNSIVATEPTVTIGLITSITTGSFDYEANITDDGGATVVGRGICYATHKNPTISDSKTTDGSGTGFFSGSIERLIPETTYYVRAYASNSAGTGYGEVKTVKLQELETLRGTEQAYPGVKGEVVTVSIGGVLLQCTKIEGKLFYQGDILIDPQILLRAAAIDYEPARWPDNIIYYAIDPNFPEKQRISDAIKLFDKTHIVFKERNTETNYILFKYIPEKGCYSWIGMIGGEQEIVIDTWGTAGNIAHEIGHALGLLHEQSKPDRDDYIIVIKENIIKGKEHNFDIWLSKGQYTEGFDFNSLMCYHSRAFAADPNKFTMTKLDGTSFYPQRERFTEKDIEFINRLYPPLSAPQLEKQSIAITEGESVEITVTEGTGSYTAESNNTEVATATVNGNTLTVKGVAEGNTTVAVTDTKTGKTTECTVIVAKKIISVTGITVSPTTKTVIESESFTLTATVSPFNAGNKSVTWKSSDATITTVDAGGKVTAKKAGTAVITVTTLDGNKTATCTVSVLAKNGNGNVKDMEGEKL